MIGWGLVALVALIHVAIVLAEMLFWQTPRVRRAFGMSEDMAARTRVLAANQGLYNGFLVAGLVWALIAGLPGPGEAIAKFFLGCVLVAGLFGAATAARRILWVQALPAACALFALMAGI
jgi:putative membrane protein